jgi:hypothetical protein
MTAPSDLLLSILAMLFSFGARISSENAVAAMKSDNYFPGGHDHGLAFGAANPDEQRKYPIACLGSSVRVLGRRFVVYLDGGGAKRFLDLKGWDSYWPDDWRFLAVQEASGA